MKLNVNTKKILADTLTPVGLYLKLRDRFHNSILLESSDYKGNKNSFSFICFDPILSFIVDEKNIFINGCGLDDQIEIYETNQVIHELKKLIGIIETNQSEVVNGLFGYSNYDAVQYFDSIELKASILKDQSIPDMQYSLYRFIIQIDHFKNELLLIENCQEEETSKIDAILGLLEHHSPPSFTFQKVAEERSNLSDQEYKEMVTSAKVNCQQGDVFQLVLSRQFSQQYKGDDFNVYRALRSINPSPYLFYFDFGNYKLFGSSPEAQLTATKEKVTINPIAGTFKRTGNDEQDKQLAEQLALDPKENAEHTMLVDLARNDLSKHGKNVTVKTYKETQFYSHVIHLVSDVEADSNCALQVFSDTFPAGTLSGAPKYRAMELIDQYESQSRGFYGGAIGMIGLDGSLNHAITIRSFMSKNNTLYFQAGAGIVVDSVEENELQEVNNKLGALKEAMNIAETL